MNNKGFEVNKSLVETLNVDDSSKKPFNSSTNRADKVDINILKSRIQEQQNKEYKKNITIFCIFVISLGALGIYLSA
tara:strand:+ start:1039 stop:1269 length:231 start_codon:yes stop_codon:yes gene_type:complete